MEELDLCGLKCPLPALMARRALARLPPGQTLWIWSNDPLAVVDIPHMCGWEGHDVIETRKTTTHHAFLIRRGPKPAAEAAASDGR